jgi:hypothetical protein
MIQVIYSGRLGNQLFQYCFGRILAEELGYKLVAEPIEGFPGTFESVSGLEFPDESPIIFSGGDRPDLDELLRNPPHRRIIANAYFQLYTYYVRYLDRIRHWLRHEEYDRSAFQSNADTLVVHIRLSGCRKHPTRSGPDAQRLTFACMTTHAGQFFRPTFCHQITGTLNDTTTGNVFRVLRT